MTRQDRSSGRLAAPELAQIRQMQRASKRKGPLANYACVSGVDPLVRVFYAQARECEIDMTALAKRAGVTRETLYNWRVGKTPNLALFRAAIEALGGQLTVAWGPAPTPAQASGEAAQPTPFGHALPDKPAPSPDTPLTQTANASNVEPMPHRGPGTTP